MSTEQRCEWVHGYFTIKVAKMMLKPLQASVSIKDVLRSDGLRQLIQTYFIRTMHIVITQWDQRSVTGKEKKPKINMPFLFRKLRDIPDDVPRRFSWREVPGAVSV